MFFHELEKFFKKIYALFNLAAPTAVKAKAQNSAGHLRIIRTFCSTEANRMWGCTEPLARRKSTAPSNQLVVRGLAIVQARARRNSSEGSLEKQRGLGILVQSKDWFGVIKGLNLNNRRTESV